MNNYYEFSSEISRLKRSNQFSQVLDFFVAHKDNFDKQQIANDKYIVANVLTSLRRINNASFAYNFLNEFSIVINEHIDEMVLNAYGWCLYDNIKNKVYNKNQLIQTLAYPIFILFSKNSSFSYTVISNIFRVGLYLAKENNNQDFLFTNDFCNLFDKSKLTFDCYSFEVEGREQASDKEKWYSQKSKALFELNMFQECFEISEEALNILDNFHNSNDLWFARRIALSKKQLGNLDEAILGLENIYKRKKEWFIQKEIADLYFEKNDIENAFKNAIQAVNARGKLEFKIGLIFLIGKILKQKNEPVLAYKHFLLIKNIREKNQWNIPNELSVELNSFDIHLEQENIKLQTELNKYWKSFVARKKLMQGVIRTILNDNERGKNGFLISNNEDYYFTLPIHIRFVQKIQEEVKVEFEIIKLQDGRKKAKIIRIVDADFS